LYKKAYKHVVDRVRARGVTNILWGFHVNHTTFPNLPWNRMALYYPGPEYVDWIGMSTYGMQNNKQGWCPFTEVNEGAYRELGAVDTTKPMVLAEWGVGEFPNHGSKAEWIRSAFDLLQHRYSRIRAAVYWHERWQNADKSYSNLRVNSSPEALQAYRESVASPYWLDRPIYKPR
ncbi:MAG TPA: glycosyl hydrolase, partial [Desulfurivibrionaceae bacterium]|nr:glycosyl hydrolase [Desulfurivibrionaceae bacterium]